ncbi:general secretion pathway protein D [Chitinivorax tropicus]|uniref:General secretion pathway protein D n=1 Tax=Chitinivorax tropicus TaxID=714531 RepID=A0A840MQX1_9PROT|nr:pilus (MSHA type) biogenesis protein MshL [Chitinivorax tropicus]MBB5019479.1 general secretion pathway protein D [Chitinivorax tropicus]
MPRCVPLVVVLPLAACTSFRPPAPDATHITAPPARAEGIPAPVVPLPTLPPPKPTARPELYSVVVNHVPVDELLFALARDAKINVDVHPGIDGTVTLNAINQTLPQLLERIANQVEMRWQMLGGNLVVMPEVPYVQHYQVDYVNMSRKMNSRVSVATAISTGGERSTGSTSKTGGQGEVGNISQTELSNVSENLFWTSVKNSIGAILDSTNAARQLEVARRAELEAKRALARMSSEERATKEAKQQSQREELRKDAELAAKAQGGAPKLFEQLRQASGDTMTAPTQSTATQAKAPTGAAGNQGTVAGADNRDVIIHPETGTITVVANSRQHREIQRFLQQVMAGAQRQVLIEATIVEVDLSDQFQSGIDWSRLSEGARHQSGVSVAMTPASLANSPFTALTFNITNPRLFSGTFRSTIKLLETFGKTKVISSPKIMALNNQTALLKVVEEKVYFTSEVRITDATSTTPEKREYTSTINTLPVGVVMNVTPQIAESGAVSLNVRPTISNITGYKIDPVPRLLKSDFDNLIPEIEVREMESTLKLMSGQVAVLGGLIRDKIEYKRDGLPWLSRLPGIGNLVSQRNDTGSKGELVIFLRPVVINDPSVNGDLAQFRAYLPSEHFFDDRRDNLAVPISSTEGGRP